MTRAREWLWRYAPAEAAAIAGATLSAIVFGWFAEAAVVAYAATIGEAIAFYGVLYLRDGAGWRTARNLMWEFGPAEVLDLLLIRPLAMYAGARLLGNFVTGVLAGKVAADAVFYTIAIISYETRKWLRRRADWIALEDSVAATNDLDSGVCEITVAGQLDLQGAGILRTAVLKSLAEQPLALLIDLAAVEVTDPVPLLVLPALNRRAVADCGLHLRCHVAAEQANAPFIRHVLGRQVDGVRQPCGRSGDRPGRIRGLPPDTRALRAGRESADPRPVRRRRGLLSVGPARSHRRRADHHVGAGHERPSAYRPVL